MSCCKEFAKQAGELLAPAGGGMMYGGIYNPKAQFEQDTDGAWNVYGCCGGGCYVVTEMRFCPYCGARIDGIKSDSESPSDPSCPITPA